MSGNDNHRLFLALFLRSGIALPLMSNTLGPPFDGGKSLHEADTKGTLPHA